MLFYVGIGVILLVGLVGKLREISVFVMKLLIVFLIED